MRPAYFRAFPSGLVNPLVTCDNRLLSLVSMGFNHDTTRNGPARCLYRIPETAVFGLDGRRRNNATVLKTYGKGLFTRF